MDNSFVAVCTVDDVKEFKSTVFKLGDSSILLTKIGADIYAFENKCSHENVPFGEREIINGQIQCPMHGSWFDLRTGAAINLPATKAVAVYAVKRIGDDIYVEEPDDW